MGRGEERSESGKNSRGWERENGRKEGKHAGILEREGKAGGGGGQGKREIRKGNRGKPEK